MNMLNNVDSNLNKITRDILHDHDMEDQVDSEHDNLLILSP